MFVLEQATGSHDLRDRHAVLLEILDDHADAEHRGLHEGAVDLVRRGLQGQADDAARQARIGQDRAVAVEPVEGHEAVLADLLLERPVHEVVKDRLVSLAGLLLVALRHAVALEPGEHVAHGRLAALDTPQLGNRAALNISEHARHGLVVLVVDDVAARGADDRRHLARLHGVGASHDDVRVDVSGSDGDARGQSRQLGHLLGHAADLLAQLLDRRVHLRLEHVAKARREGLVELLRRVLPIGQHALVARIRGREAQLAGQLPRDPVEQVDEVRRLLVDLGRLLERLEDLREEHLRGEDAAVALKPLLAALFGERDDPVSLILAAVVLPQLHVGVRFVLELVVLRKRLAVLVGHEHGGRRRVNAHAHDVILVDARVLDGVRDGIAEHVHIVARVVEGELRWELLAVARIKRPVHHAVLVFGDGCAHLLAIRGAHDDGAAR